MNSSSDIDTAHQLSRKRARMLPMLAMIFIIQQATYFVGLAEDGSRSVDRVKIAAWLIMSVVLLLALTTGGSWLRSRKVRMLMDDEVTRANRAEALRVGFIATMASSLLLYVITLFEPMNGREAIHLLTTIGLAVALLRFAILERRALADE